jgi:hypothetical protein
MVNKTHKITATIAPAAKKNLGTESIGKSKIVNTEMIKPIRDGMIVANQLLEF